MFNNILYFITVLLIFNISPSADTPKDPFVYHLSMFLLTWLAFAVYCRWSFRSLISRFRDGIDFQIISRYQALTFRLSILAIFLFTLDIFAFHFKYWLQIVPGFKQFIVLQGALALILFIVYLGTIWYFAHPVYLIAFETEIQRLPFILSNAKLNLPIIFPWLFLTFFYDLFSHVPFPILERFLNKPAGQILFYTVFLSVLVIFLPRFIKSWWGCKPFQPSSKIQELKDFLTKEGLKYRDLLQWPIFEGRIMTAGIMGIVPRYRYILVTDALMGVLSMLELKAVLAHEMGHAKCRHLLLYVFFIFGYLIFWFGLFDPEFYIILETYIFEKFTINISQQTLFYLIYTPSILIPILLYFRYVMGFFMRQFERQADLFSARTMGSPRYTVSSLEKIALLSGKIRELPSWHHFSIKERVDFLWRTLEEPGLIRKHNRFVVSSFCLYLVCMIGLGYLFNFSQSKQNLTYMLHEGVLNQQLIKNPKPIPVYRELAMIYHERGKYKKAIEAYENILDLDQAQAVALNNLAWLLVTVPDESLREYDRALTLAKRAVALERSPIYLDTIAEAYHANGYTHEAIKAIDEAIAVASENRKYYEKQRKKFMGED
jgi:Zn-dependent protease with chaperone function